MSTLNQISKKKRKRIRKKLRPALDSSPFLKGVCFKVITTSPKKPNSAVRKIARVILSTGKMVTTSIPGQGHNLQKHSSVLVRGGRCRDIPGVKYKLVKGKYDFDNSENFERRKSRSKYGLKKIKN